MDTGRHLLVTERESVYDMARKKWAEKVTGVQDEHVSKTTEEIKASSCKATPLRKDRPLQDWALKLQRKGQRETESVKNFLLEKFNKGGKTGNSYIMKRIFFKKSILKLCILPSVCFFIIAGECSFV